MDRAEAGERLAAVRRQIDIIEYGNDYYTNNPELVARLHSLRAREASLEATCFTLSKPL